MVESDNETTSSDSDYSVDDSVESETFEDLENPEEATIPNEVDTTKLKEGTYVFAQFVPAHSSTKRKVTNKYFVGVIWKILCKDSLYDLKSMRVNAKKSSLFHFPAKDDFMTVPVGDILRILTPVGNQKATKRQQAFLDFGINFREYMNNMY